MSEVLSVFILQRRLDADLPGPGVSFDIVLKSISGASYKTFITSQEIVETAPSEALQGVAEGIVEVNDDGNLDASNKDTNTDAFME